MKGDVKRYMKQCKDCGYFHGILSICLVGLWCGKDAKKAKVKAVGAACHEFLSVPKIAKELDRK